MRARSALALALVLLLSAVLAAAEHPRSRRAARHQALTAGLDCSTCHTTQGWSLIEGSAEGGAFDHSRTGFPLAGRHKHTACTSCHQRGRRIARVCVNCHEDAHEQRLSQSCDRCHSAVSWRSTRAIERHRLTRLPLTGMHALADCSECHQRRGSREWSSVPADCFSCHAAEYRRTDIHPSHVGVPGDASRPPFPHNCALCHRATGWVPAFLPNSRLASRSTAQGLTLKATQHEARFPIRSGKHRGAPCVSCHTSATLPRSVRCDGCHAHDRVRLTRVHQRVLGGLAGSCIGCHPGGAHR